MGYKKRITKSVVLDSASPNSALDVMVDWVVNKFITDVPDLKIQKEIAYSADGYKRFPVSRLLHMATAIRTTRMRAITSQNSSAGTMGFSIRFGLTTVRLGWNGTLRLRLIHLL